MNRLLLPCALGLALLVVSLGCRKRNSPAADFPATPTLSPAAASLLPVIPTEPHLQQTLQQVNEAIQAHVKSGKPAPRTLDELNTLRLTEFIAPPPTGRAWHIAAGRLILVAK